MQPHKDYKIYPAELAFGVMGLRESIIHADCWRTVDGGADCEIKAIFIDMLDPIGRPVVFNITKYVTKDALKELIEKVKNNYLHDVFNKHRAEGEVLDEAWA